jgi:hypothetical protein
MDRLWVMGYGLWVMGYGFPPLPITYYLLPHLYAINIASP